VSRQGVRARVRGWVIWYMQWRRRKRGVAAPGSGSGSVVGGEGGEMMGGEGGELIG
jgi:hypothetical protein